MTADDDKQIQVQKAACIIPCLVQCSRQSQMNRIGMLVTCVHAREYKK